MCHIFQSILLSILGVMKRSDLSQIFRSERFPANLMSQYINLLSKFEVALPWSAEFLLVPSLLPDSQQETNQPVAAGVSSAVAQAMNTTAYTKSKVLRRQYVMSYVPSGFWPRLITRLVIMKMNSSPFKSTFMLVYVSRARSLVCKPCATYSGQSERRCVT